jgi:cytosine/adenosine deaminase-related metal-dependent hydrolase
MTTLYNARWVLPMSSAPVPDGAIAVAGEHIIAVGQRAAIVAQFPQATVRDFGEAAILPGLVNAHSHLELTAMRGFLETEESDFSAWLKKLTVARLERMTPDDLYVSAAWGACEAARAGVTCLGDASDAAVESMKALRAIGLRGTVYQESFGPDPRLVNENIEKLKTKVSLLREHQTPLVRAGVSPHAPYTVCGAQIEMIADFAIAEELALMMHAAESAAEGLFMRKGAGPFAESLAKRGIQWQAPGVSTIQYLEKLGVLRTRPLLAHCINVDDADIETIKQTGARVAHCPKSNAKLGHGRAPFAKFLTAGIALGLGSDSVASNNTCDIIEEARFALLLGRVGRRKDDDAEMISAKDALSSATIEGARALGFDGHIGELKTGVQADFIAVSLSGTHQLPSYDPVSTLILASSGRDVMMTVVAGREVFRDGRVTTVDENRLRVRMREIETKLRF